MTDEQGTALATKNGALKGAAVSAAVAAAVYGLRRALAANEGLSLHAHDEHDERDTRRENGGSRSGSLVITALESASDHVLPLAEAQRRKPADGPPRTHPSWFASCSRASSTRSEPPPS